MNHSISDFKFQHSVFCQFKVKRWEILTDCYSMDRLDFHRQRMIHYLPQTSYLLAPDWNLQLHLLHLSCESGWKQKYAFANYLGLQTHSLSFCEEPHCLSVILQLKSLKLLRDCWMEPLKSLSCFAMHKNKLWYRCSHSATLLKCIVFVGFLKELALL